MKIADNFHSQFVLNYDKYLDNNNYVRFNLVKTKDDRVNFLAGYKYYYFLDNVAYPQWTGSRWDHTDNVTYSEREGTVNVHYKQIFGAYFFYNEERVEHSRKAQDWLRVFGQVGGL